MASAKPKKRSPRAARRQDVGGAPAPRARALIAAKRELAGWGNYPRSVSEVVRPEDLGAVAGCVDPAGTLARGLGRSYGDAALNRDRRVVDCQRLDRILSFDEHTGVLTCEAGVSLADIIHTFA